VKIAATHRYDASVDTVFGLFHDPAFMQAKYTGIGARNVAVPECTGGDGRYRVRITREVPAEVPSLLARFVQPWNTIEQRETWDGRPGGPYRCRIDIEIAGIPVRMGGEMQLHAEGAGCVNEVRLEVTSGIPLVGGRLADFVGGDAQKAIHAEYEFIRAHLARR
jgi:hypothetical protein